MLVLGMARLGVDDATGQGRWLILERFAGVHWPGAMPEPVAVEWTCAKMTIRNVCIAILMTFAPLVAADWLTDGGNIKRVAWEAKERVLNKENLRALKIL